MSEIDVKAPKSIDFDKEGLMVGLEFHQQILAPYNDNPDISKSGSKLFCPCAANLRDDDPHFTVIRKFRAVSGEIGEVDITAQFERNKQSTTIYEGYNDTTCLIELDEEPILPINQQALFRTLTIAKKLFHLELVNEILVNRKAIIDGSNTSGFQRTAQIAFGSDNSYIMVDDKKIRLYQANLEEDSAKNVGTEGKTRKFRLDRLGIPLIEIATYPDMHSPEEALNTAYRIGTLLRTTGFVKRGQGTIRQDLNVSIKRGTRIEIKGVSELDLVKDYVTNEAIRQARMLEFLDLIKTRGLTSKSLNSVQAKDVSKIFSKCNAKFVKSALKNGETVMGAKLPLFDDLLKYELQPNYRVGSELSEISKVTAGVGGILHSDELPKFGISQEEVDEVKNLLKINDDDGFMLVVGPKTLGQLAISGVVNNIKLWLEHDGLIPEVRAPRADGTTGFLRPLPGKARMYPETDSKPIHVENDLMQRINEMEFEMPEDRINRYIKELKLPKKLANQLVLHPLNSLFEDVLIEHKVDPVLVATTITDTMVELRRDNVDVDSITDNQFFEIFASLEKDEISKDAVRLLLKGFAESKSETTVEKLIQSLGLEKMDDSAIQSMVSKVAQDNMDIIEQKGMGAMGSLMRFAMEELGGKADGKVVSQFVRDEIKKLSKKS